jgi:Tfp pilus assembly protein PilF
MRQSVILVVILCTWVGLVGCGPATPPDPSSEAYQQAVSAFYSGLAAMEAGSDTEAEQRLLAVAERFPQEPAAWVNLGVLALRRNDLAAAAERLDKARALAPDNSAIQTLLGLLANLQGQPEAALPYLRQAVALDSTNLQAGYALAQLLEAQGASVDEVARLLDQMLAHRPENRALLVERLRVAARQGTTPVLQQVLDRLERLSADWPAEARTQLAAVQAAVPTPDRLAPQVQVLKNVLLRVPAYRNDLAMIQRPVEQVGDVLSHFLWLPAPPFSVSAPDDSLQFMSETQQVGAGGWQSVALVWLTDEVAPVYVLATDEQLSLQGDTVLAFPGGVSKTPPSPQGVVGVDYDNDFWIDLVVAGAGGFRLYRQDSTGTLTDVTPRLSLTPAVTQAAYTAVWPADLDLEGDLDLVLARSAGPPVFLRNNGDGTFVPVSLFPEVAQLQAFAWGDLEADGDPDAVLLDVAGQVHVYLNERGGVFEQAPSPTATPALALEIADPDGDAQMDLLVLHADGSLVRLTHQAAWQQTALAQWTGLDPALVSGLARLWAADVDNNGGLDLVASTPTEARLWLSDPQGAFQPLPFVPEAPVWDVADLDGDQRLDLAGLSPDGQPVRMVNRGVKAYNSKMMSVRAATTLGDQRINSFGLGGEIELRAGLLFQKQRITRPLVHFGLGAYAAGDVARIVWPNGSVQAEFDLLSDGVIATQQRLKGSCPWLFTWNGQEMTFVTDFIWRSPLGLKINAQETAGVMTTEDRVKVRGDQLVPRDGFYDLRITAELWETHFFDHVSLLVVDHPRDTEVLIDERFAFPPPSLEAYLTAPLQPVASARDDLGQDVTAVLRERDARYLGTFGRGHYQGVTRDHYVEIDLGDGLPAQGPLWLVASGWVRPTDSSLNVALGQGQRPPPQGLRLEVPDGQGGWKLVQANLGFPAGKTKTVLFDLTHAFLPNTPRRVRLGTNLEIYWDAVWWTTTPPDTSLRTQHLAPATAELRHRGYSAVTIADEASPEVPHYERLVGTGQVWRDLIGYYTRFGDVRGLLEAVDDRYVIMNAGDEMAFRFPVPAPPPEGWVRDFVLIGDGWVKDGDYNTTFSKTVQPLPSHDQPTYTTPPGRLEDDPVYRRHAADWQTYHTRYVVPDRFQQALRLSTPAR